MRDNRAAARFAARGQHEDRSQSLQRRPLFRLRIAVPPGPRPRSVSAQVRLSVAI